MTINSSANSIILIHFAFSDNLSAENSKSSADFCIQCIQLLECMDDNVHEDVDDDDVHDDGGGDDGTLVHIGPE